MAADALHYVGYRLGNVMFQMPSQFKKNRALNFLLNQTETDLLSSPN